MLTEAPDRAEAAAGWQQRLQQMFRGCFRQLAESLTCDGQAGAELGFELIKESPRAISLRMNAGSESGFLKLFDGPGGSEAYKREKAALLAFAGKGVLPELISFSDEMLFILTEWHGQPFDPAANPEGTARRTGAWMARYDAAAPSRKLEGNWYNYGLSIGLGAALQSIPGAQAQLAAVPLCGEVLSRNEAALHNFVEGPDGRLLGCDFENARFKPRGWDYIRGYWSLLERFPDKARVVLKAYQRGFELSHRGMLQAQELSSVARILFCAQALSSVRQGESDQWL